MDSTRRDFLVTAAAVAGATATPDLVARFTQSEG